MQSQALVPSWTLKSESSFLSQALSVFGGVLMVSLLAQIVIPLPFTPVPITGQTFGVALLGLLWGRRLGLLSVLAYVLIGVAGAPVFASGASGFTWGPTFGYLVGMIFSVYFVGTLADRGWAKGFWRAWLLALSGSFFIFAFGLAVLSYFVPGRELLAAGFFPFLPGDLLKTGMAAAVASAGNGFLRR